MRILHLLRVRKFEFQLDRFRRPPINQRKQVISFDLVLTDHHKLSFRRQNVTYNEYLPVRSGLGTDRPLLQPSEPDEWVDMDLAHQPEHHQRGEGDIQP